MKSFTRKERETLDENQTNQKKFKVSLERKENIGTQESRATGFLFRESESDSRWILFLA